LIRSHSIGDSWAAACSPSPVPAFKVSEALAVVVVCWGWERWVGSSVMRPTTRASCAARARRTRQIVRNEEASISVSASAFTASPASWTSAGSAVTVSSPTSGLGK
jgi:hypothetical protein